MSHPTPLTTSLLAAVLLSCASESELMPTQCLRLSAAEDGVLTGTPAKVSLLFTVETCDAKPVVGLTEKDFDIEENEKPVSTFESQRKVEPRGQRYRVDSLLMLDLSGSILKSGQFPALQRATQRYVDRVLQNTNGAERVAVYTFDGRASPQLLIDFTSDATAVKAAIDALAQPMCQANVDCAGFADRRTCAGWLCVDDSTNLNGAVTFGIDRLEREQLVDPTLRFHEAALVLFTDGADQAARVETRDAMKRVEGTKVHVFAVGLGDEVDEQALQGFGKDGFQPAGEAAELEAAFQKVADKIFSMANRYYLLEYCSPKRGGSHELKVSARWMSPEYGLLEGSLLRRFDATGFTSGCAL